jgi:STE24 endopeptidase
MPRRRRGTLLASLLLALAAAAPGQEPPAPPPEPPAVDSTPVATPLATPLDPVVATEAYLARLSPEERARSDAYFEGGYWLTLWSLLYGLGVAGLLLSTGLSARMRDLAARITRRGPLRTAIYWAQYLIATTLATAPLTVYQGYFREHRYGLATQTFGPWLADQGKGLAVGLVLGAPFLALLYGILRRAPRTWWIWGAAASTAFLAFVALIAPVYINPLFNEYTPLADPAVRDPILAMARANGIPAEEVWQVDASRQTTRISANVSGFLGTERITLNDNLLRRSTPAEIAAVMGHEMGHYVLNHVYELLIEFAVVVVAGFAFLRWGAARALRRWGSRWRVADVGDAAGLPLLGALLAIFFFVATPVTNTIIRVNEVEADIFGLNAAREPEGFAEVALKLGEYRKLAPGPLEELLFFDHPSGRNRILMAMRWRAENPEEMAATADE